MMYRFMALAALVGCNSYTTVEEACLDEVPGSSFVTDSEDLEIIARMNCYRRLAKTTKARVDPLLQESVEGHRDYMELNKPELNFRLQSPEREGFTGATGFDRLDATGYQMLPNTSLLELYTYLWGSWTEGITGADHIDLWFADPFIRPAFLQPNLAGSGVATAEFVQVFEPSLELPDLPVKVAYYNLVYRYLTPAIAEVAKAYPRNGQLDAPGSYLHLTENTALEAGVVYGYPITFTVGSAETNLVVEQASIVGPGGSLPFQIFTGDDASGSFGLSNTAILVPTDPLVAGATYTAFVQLASDQGVRKAKTTFTVGAGVVRPLPDALLRMAVDTPELLPRIGANLVREQLPTP